MKGIYKNPCISEERDKTVILNSPIKALNIGFGVMEANAETSGSTVVVDST